MIVTWIFYPASNISTAIKYTSIDSKHKLLWKTKIGNTSFRTNIFLNDTVLIIGSNGENYMDYQFSDQGSGVYFINPKNGQIRINAAESDWGDFDVNGVLVYNNLLYYGNDNEEFICSDLNGRILWRKVASGDIEHKPVLLNIRGKNLIVYASELGEVRAIEPKTGKKIWSYFAPSFSGWKDGDNTSLFKVKAFLSNTKSFFTAPILVDLNDDKISDLVYLGYDNIIYAINGETGNLFWTYEEKNGYITNIAKQSGRDGKNQVQVIVHNYSDLNSLTKQESFTISLSGAKMSASSEYYTELPISSLNDLEIGVNSFFISSVDSLYYFEDNKIKQKIYTGETYIFKNWENNLDTTSRNSANQLFADKLIKYGSHEKCAVILNQFDYGDEERIAFLIIVNVETEEVVVKLSLESSSEMPPVIVDVNKDGKNEILVSCSNGYLYCYQL